MTSGRESGASGGVDSFRNLSSLDDAIKPKNIR